MQLRDIAAALRKSEDVNDKLRALKHLEGALLAAPDELKHHAGLSALCHQMTYFILGITVPSELTALLFCFLTLP